MSHVNFLRNLAEDIFSARGANPTSTGLSLAADELSTLRTQNANMRKELAEISSAIDDPRTDLTNTMPELITELKQKNAEQAERIRQLEGGFSAELSVAMRTIMSQSKENQKLRAALVSAREGFDQLIEDGIISVDRGYGTLGVTYVRKLCESNVSKIDAILSGQPDGPGEEDGPWAEGWKERVGQSVEDPRDKSDCHGPDWTERDKEYLK